MEDKETFYYNYSARQQTEVQKIRDKYIEKEEDKLTMLRRLDQQATRPGLIVSLRLGVVSTLVFGLGMCCTIVWTADWFVPGIIIGVIGMIGMALSYPVYVKITRHQRKKLAPEIIALSDELLQSF